jgi:putative flippase GtrA
MRRLKFSALGTMALQLAPLAFFANVGGMPYLLTKVISAVAAILNHFVWHR